MMVEAISNLLAGIQPRITSANKKFLGSNRPDPGFINFGGLKDLD